MKTISLLLCVCFLSYTVTAGTTSSLHDHEDDCGLGQCLAEQTIYEGHIDTDLADELNTILGTLTADATFDEISEAIHIAVPHLSIIPTSDLAKVLVKEDVLSHMALEKNEVSARYAETYLDSLVQSEVAVYLVYGDGVEPMAITLCSVCGWVVLLILSTIIGLEIQYWYEGGGRDWLIENLRNTYECTQNSLHQFIENSKNYVMPVPWCNGCNVYAQWQGNYNFKCPVCNNWF